MMIQRDDDKKIKGVKKIKDKSLNFQIKQGSRVFKLWTFILLPFGNFIGVENLSSLDLSEVGFWIGLLLHLP